MFGVPSGKLLGFFVSQHGIEANLDKINSFKKRAKGKKGNFNKNGKLMTHKYMGSIVAFSISKSVEPNKEQKEMTSGFQQGNVCKC